MIMLFYLFLNGVIISYCQGASFMLYSLQCRQIYFQFRIVIFKMHTFLNNVLHGSTALQSHISR